MHDIYMYTAAREDAVWVLVHVVGGARAHAAVSRKCRLRLVDAPLLRRCDSRNKENWIFNDLITIITRSLDRSNTGRD